MEKETQKTTTLSNAIYDLFYAEFFHLTLLLWLENRNILNQLNQTLILLYSYLTANWKS